ncbi:TetR/AcrR family transcriptional regulator [Streptomyces sp. NPDC016845]|uniref:TetR/AcrR family transcriptional regulator n=1 Tax=Streptomyces sp. NPDC016845 TaxID=3364972 RepID=UPI0037A8080A
MLARTPDPPVSELVEAFAAPLFDEMPADNKGGDRRTRLIVMILSDPAEEARNWTGTADGEIRERYFAAFARVLPDLPPEELGFRMRGIFAVTAIDRLQVHQQPSPGCASPVAGEAARRWAITFLTAAMSAPANWP